MNERLAIVKGVDPSSLVGTPGFYKITDCFGGIRYVGSTNNLYSRFHNHKHQLTTQGHVNSRLQDVSDHGVLYFVPTVTPTKEEALEIEQSHLDDDALRATLCNVATDAVASATDLRRTPEHRQKLRQAMLGKRHSEATRAKMSQSRIGHSHNAGYEQTAEQIAARVAAISSPVVIDDVKYPSMKLAAQALGVAQQTVSNRCASSNFPTWARNKK